MSLRCANCEEMISYLTKDGKMVPVDIGTDKRHNCPMSKYNIRKRTEARAKKATKLEIGKIDDFAIISDLQEDVKHANTRLVAHTLRLEIIPKEGIEF